MFKLEKFIADNVTKISVSKFEPDTQANHLT